jgi:hypothetical protein
MENSKAVYSIEASFARLVEGKNRYLTSAPNTLVVFESPSELSAGLKAMISGDSPIGLDVRDQGKTKVATLFLKCNGQTMLHLSATNNPGGVVIPQWDRVGCYQVGEALLKSLMRDFPEQAKRLKAKAVEADLGL